MEKVSNATSHLTVRGAHTSPPLPIVGDVLVYRKLSDAASVILSGDKWGSDYMIISARWSDDPNVFWIVDCEHRRSRSDNARLRSAHFLRDQSSEIIVEWHSSSAGVGSMSAFLNEELHSRREHTFSDINQLEIIIERQSSPAGVGTSSHFLRDQSSEIIVEWHSSSAGVGSSLVFLSEELHSKREYTFFRDQSSGDHIVGSVSAFLNEELHSRREHTFFRDQSSGDHCVGGRSSSNTTHNGLTWRGALLSSICRTCWPYTAPRFGFGKNSFLTGFGLGFLAFGLKKLLLPLFIGAQVVKSVLLAMFLPSIIGGIAKLMGKGLTSVAQSSSSSGSSGGADTISDFDFKDSGAGGGGGYDSLGAGSDDSNTGVWTYPPDNNLARQPFPAYTSSGLGASSSALKQPLDRYASHVTAIGGPIVL
ncbi:hypothetical protein J6590_051054 [Homalodisca vitripennis]|nr:hypothetical protein J6590_051054 [Homalodisca vitripennis]